MKYFHRQRFYAASIALLSLFLFISLFAYAAAEDDARVQNREGVFKAKSGDFEGALRALESACRQNPFDETALSNLACAHNNLGVLLVNQHHFDEAIRHFRSAKAQKPDDLQVRFNLLSALITVHEYQPAEREVKEILALRPKDKETLLKAAMAFQKMEDDETAQNLLEKITRLAPADFQAFFSLGRLHYRKGNFREAKFNLQRALEISPKNASATNLLERLEREDSIESGFERDVSVHFSLRIEDAFPHDWTDDLLELFEDAYQKVGDRLGCFPTRQAEIIVYSPSEFQKVRSFPVWAGGVYDGKIRLPVSSAVSNSEQLRGAVYHEYTHHLIHLLTDGNCPGWLNEGLAQIMEGIDPQKATAILKDQDSCYWQPIKNLEGAFSQAKSRVEAERLYAQSLLVVSSIMDEKGFTGIQGILIQLGKKYSIEDAVRLTLGQSAETIDEKIRQSLE